MEKQDKDKDLKILKAECPCCRSLLWIDINSHEVIEFERKIRKKGNLDELLLKEKERKAGFEARFASTAELAKEKQKEANKRFQEAFSRHKVQDDEDQK